MFIANSLDFLFNSSNWRLMRVRLASSFFGKLLTELVLITVFIY